MAANAAKKNDLVSEEYERLSDDDNEAAPRDKRRADDDKREINEKDQEKDNNRGERSQKNADSDRGRFPPRQRSPHRSGRFDRERSPRKRSRSRERKRFSEGERGAKHKDDAQTEEGELDDGEEQRHDRGDRRPPREERSRFRDERPSRAGHNGRSAGDRGAPVRRPFQEDPDRDSRRNYGSRGDDVSRRSRDSRDGRFQLERNDRDRNDRGEGFARHGESFGRNFRDERGEGFSRAPPSNPFAGRGWADPDRENPRWGRYDDKGPQRWCHDMFEQEAAANEESQPRSKFDDLDARRKAQMEKLEAMLA